ncbi:hypothetical protein HK102_001841, partial [Quaeritorhiza haematococci]
MAFVPGLAEEGEALRFPCDMDVGFWYKEDDDRRQDGGGTGVDEDGQATSEQGVHTVKQEEEDKGEAQKGEEPSAQKTVNGGNDEETSRSPANDSHGGPELKGTLATHFVANFKALTPVVESFRELFFVPDPELETGEEGNEALDTERVVGEAASTKTVLPIRLEIPIQIALETLLERSRAIQRDRMLFGQEISHENKIANMRKLIESYRKFTVAYNDTENEPVFPKAYNAIINSNTPDIFDTLLQLETNYAQTVEEVRLAQEKAIEDIQERHAREMERAVEPSRNGSPDFSMIVARHVEDMEILQATLTSELEELHKSQRREYRDFVIKVYEEMQRRAAGPTVSLSPESEAPPTSLPSSTSAAHAHKRSLSGSDGTSSTSTSTSATKERRSWLPPNPVPASGSSAQPPQPEGKNVVSAAIRRLDRKPSMELMNMDPEEAMRLTERLEQASPASEAVAKPPPKPPEPAKVEDPELVKMANELQEMGFAYEQAVAALELTDRNVEQAIVILIENPDRIKNHLSKKSAALSKQQHQPAPPTVQAPPQQPSAMDRVIRRSTSFMRLRSTSNPLLGGSSTSAPTSTPNTPPDSPPATKRAFSRTFMQQQQQQGGIGIGARSRASSITSERDARRGYGYGTGYSRGSTAMLSTGGDRDGPQDPTYLSYGASLEPSIRSTSYSITTTTGTHRQRSTSFSFSAVPTTTPFAPGTPSTPGPFTSQSQPQAQPPQTPPTLPITLTREDRTRLLTDLTSHYESILTDMRATHTREVMELQEELR